MFCLSLNWRQRDTHSILTFNPCYYLQTLNKLNKQKSQFTLKKNKRISFLTFKWFSIDSTNTCLLSLVIKVLSIMSDNYSTEFWLVVLICYSYKHNLLYGGCLKICAECAMECNDVTRYYQVSSQKLALLLVIEVVWPIIFRDIW